MYKVIRDFADLQDNEHVYHAGDSFPREGHEASEKRLTELLNGSNRLGVPLIEFDATAAEKTPVEQGNEGSSDAAIPDPEPKPKPRRGRRKTNAD